MIGWENDRGAYFINKLQEQIDNSASDISNIEGDIGKMSDLTTTADNLVGAINEVDSDAGTALDDIGTMSNLETTATDLVGAINEVMKTGITHLGQVDANTTTVFDVENGTRLIAFVVGVDEKGILMLYVTGSGSVSRFYDTGGATSKFAFNTSANTLSITSSSASDIQLYGIAVNGSFSRRTGG